MNVDKVQTKMCRRLQGTVGFVGAFLTQGGVHFPARRNYFTVSTCHW